MHKPTLAAGPFAFCGAGLSCFSQFSFSDFMLGFADNPSSVENHFFGQAVVTCARCRTTNFIAAFYVDDTFRLTNKLTLNLGLRYELQGPWSERYNRQIGVRSDSAKLAGQPERSPRACPLHRVSACPA